MMTVHKLSAGDGYTYYTREVASGDELRTRTVHWGITTPWTATRQASGAAEEPHPGRLRRGHRGADGGPVR